MSDVTFVQLESFESLAAVKGYIRPPNNEYNWRLMTIVPNHSQVLLIWNGSQIDGAPKTMLSAPMSESMALELARLSSDNSPSVRRGGNGPGFTPAKSDGADHGTLERSSTIEQGLKS
jgi:hypothetical protein